jgi:hypothetical protein
MSIEAQESNFRVHRPRAPQSPIMGGVMSPRWTTLHKARRSASGQVPGRDLGCISIVSWLASSHVTGDSCTREESKPRNHPPPSSLFAIASVHVRRNIVMWLPLLRKERDAQPFLREGANKRRADVLLCKKFVDSLQSKCVRITHVCDERISSAQHIPLTPGNRLR